ncbi:MAG: hypothetical protein VYA87_04955 [SAR324 cluster bacterium]|nr:hypothetical protein [SAR324 cluster bacterium]
MIIITNAKLFKRSGFNILAYAFSLMLCINIFQLKIGFSQTELTNTEEEKNNQDTAENSTKTNDNKDNNAVMAAVMKADNSSSVDPQEEKIRRKAMAMILNISKANNPLTNKQSASIFNLNEQKQKDRKKGKREMQSYNQRNDKEINVFFQRFQKRRYQSVNYSGKHDDYTGYIQNFQANSSR